ncbi:MAG: cupin domain-containing protein [Smithella sp.]
MISAKLLKILCSTLALLWSICVTPCFAESPVPKGLVDSSPNKAILMNFDEWYAKNKKPDDPKISGMVVFNSPRSMVAFRNAGKGTVVPVHFHATADEILIITGGSGQIQVNGEWIAIKAGDVHVNPRGIIHSARAGKDEDLRFIQIFAPAQPTGGDTNIIK